jgi:hypothetical protein
MRTSRTRGFDIYQGAAELLGPVRPCRDDEELTPTGS